MFYAGLVWIAYWSLTMTGSRRLPRGVRNAAWTYHQLGDWVLDHFSHPFATGSITPMATRRCRPNTNVHSFKMRCRFKKCTFQSTRRFIDAHESECKFSRIPCPFTLDGCSFSGSIQDVHSHLVDPKNKHIKLLIDVQPKQSYYVSHLIHFTGQTEGGQTARGNQRYHNR
jgi:hypothetical protein